MLTNLCLHSFLLFIVMMLGNSFCGHSQSSVNQGKSTKINNIEQVMHNLTLHNDINEHQEESESGTTPVNAPDQKDPMKNHQRISSTKPQDGNYQKIRLIDLNERKVGNLKRRLTTHQAKGKSVYVKKEVVRKIDRLEKEGLVNVDIADTGVVSFAVDEGLMNGDSTTSTTVINANNTLASFTVGAKNTSANHLYRITKDGNYQYKDGKKIVGSQTSQQWFQNGYKPITATTFYYEIADQPHISLNKSDVKSFTSMNVTEQVALIKESIKRSSDYVELAEFGHSKASIPADE